MNGTNKDSVASTPQRIHTSKVCQRYSDKVCQSRTLKLQLVATICLSALIGRQTHLRYYKTKLENITKTKKFSCKSVSECIDRQIPEECQTTERQKFIIINVAFQRSVRVQRIYKYVLLCIMFACQRQNAQNITVPQTRRSTRFRVYHYIRFSTSKCAEYQSIVYKYIV